MNEMSSSFAASQEVTSQSTSMNLDDAHIFRSKLMDKFAEIETWLNCKFGKLSPDIVGKRPLGQKLEAIRKLAEQAEPKLKNPAKLLRLLEQLQPYADLRGELAHSTLSILNTEQQGMVLVYENANDTVHLTVKKSGRLTSGQMKHYLNRTGDIRDQLKLLDNNKS